ncbi:hypothetical protein PV328_001221 [Microctonus aethiopoides]|uniref:Uncharacterized protein n=1 Tax=Microctonus aethiopoides TaxID=144406 RepID=A0AA39FWH1_9HYME|nr:hypothetical protein PV328_001221 [Microctonus aethiopoides]
MSPIISGGHHQSHPKLSGGVKMILVEDTIANESRLEVEINYKVTEMKTVKTKFGESLVVTLNEEFTVFLPSRIVKYLMKEREQYKLLSDAAPNGKLNMHYIGGQYRECEFINVELRK